MQFLETQNSLLIKSLHVLSLFCIFASSELTGDRAIPLLATKNKSKNRYHKSEQVFTAVFEKGVLKPLTEIRLPKRKKLTVIVRSNGKSIASQMYGLFKRPNQAQVDALIESEDWL